jgi:hypothetical protein
MCEKVVADYFDVLRRHSLVMTKENHDAISLGSQFLAEIRTQYLSTRVVTVTASSTAKNMTQERSNKVVNFVTKEHFSETAIHCTNIWFGIGNHENLSA